MTEKTLTTENIKPALDALRGELAPWPVVAKKQDRLNTAQLNAANSGITSSLVAQIIANTAAIRALESAITGTGLRALVVASLPAVGTTGILYIVPVTTYDPATDADVVNYSNEYLWIVAPDAPVTEGYYEQVGQTGIVINNGQLNITVNGTSVGTFTANQSGDTTAAITVPTNADYVDLTTDQTIAGVKAFSSTITGTASKAIADEDGTSIKTGYVNVAGNQTVSGDKSFTGSNTFNNILPNATNTYSLGSSSYQWSSVYAQTYYYGTTPFTDKFVTTDTVQTISGAKTFSSPIKTAGHKLFGDVTDLNDAYYNNEICRFSPTILNNPTGGYGTVWTVNAAVNIPDNPYTSWISQIALYDAGMKRRYRSNGGEWTSWENILTESNAKPSTNGTQDLGTPTNQWKSVYSQTYYYNGTAWGLDKANTWTGYNTFTNYITSQESAAIPAGGYGKGIAFRDYQNNRFGYIQPYLTPDSEKRLIIGVDSGDIASDSNIIPNANNAVNLGTSTNKWKTLNGINPGALSLPDFTSETGVSLSAGANTYTPVLSGWLSISTTGDISVVCGNFCHKATDMISVPVIAGKTYTVTMPSAATGYFYSCLGNV